MSAADILVVGGGIAGASVAAELAAGGRRVVLLEAERQPGRHSTGRSAALWILNYGPRDVRLLSAESRPFFHHPPPGFAAHALTRRRAVLFLAPADQVGRLDRMLADGEGLRPIDPAEARRLVPILRPDYAAAAAIEEEAFDIDVHALHQGWLRALRAHGGALITEARVEAIQPVAGLWRVTTPAGRFAAPILVNAAGAWADEVARLAAVAPLGLTPMRRTAVLVDVPPPNDPADWPLVGDADHTWYARPEAGRRLMLSPADEQPMPPCDVQPDEYDVALAVDRAQAALDLPVRRVGSAWAGLRTFTPDRSLAIGFAADAKGFFWLAGQGGYGIQTAPAAARLAAELVLGRTPSLPEVARLVDPARFAHVGAWS